MAWTLKVEGQVVREHDLTLGEVELLEAATSETWRTLNPLRSAGCAKAMYVVLLQQRSGMNVEAATKQADGMLVTEFLELVGVYDPDEDLPTQYEDGNPQKVAETSTGG